MRSREVINTRAIGKRQIAPENFLIMCEGKETEPNYFNGLKQLINSKYGDKVFTIFSAKHFIFNFIIALCFNIAVGCLYDLMEAMFMLLQTHYDS